MYQSSILWPLTLWFAEEKLKTYSPQGMFGPQSPPAGVWVGSCQSSVQRWRLPLGPVVPHFGSVRVLLW